jgi:hypothetical protein
MLKLWQLGEKNILEFCNRRQYKFQGWCWLKNKITENLEMMYLFVKSNIIHWIEFANFKVTGFTPGFCGVRVTHLFSFLCCVSLFFVFVCLFVFVLCVVCSMLSVSLDCPFLIDSSGFSVRLITNKLCIINSPRSIFWTDQLVKSAVGRQSAIYTENSWFASPALGRHISTFRGYRILFSIRNSYINRFTRLCQPSTSLLVRTLFPSTPCCQTKWLGCNS